eukprot:364813-Chlamydomonas_euryale.AAC.6
MQPCMYAANRCGCFEGMHVSWQKLSCDQSLSRCAPGLCSTHAGVGRPKMVRILFPTTGVPFSKCMEAVRSNGDLDGRITLVLEQKGTQPQSAMDLEFKQPAAGSSFDPKAVRTICTCPCWTFRARVWAEVALSFFMWPCAVDGVEWAVDRRLLWLSRHIKACEADDVRGNAAAARPSGEGRRKPT